MMNVEKYHHCLSEILKCPLDTILNYNPIASLSEIGLTSIAFIQMVVLLESEYDIEFQDSDLRIENMDTLDKIDGLLNKYDQNS